MASLIDLHTHTAPSSGCSQMRASELIEAAIEAGLDGVAVTEHLVIGGSEAAQDLARRKYGFPVYRGVEATATVLGDVLVYGSYRDFRRRIPWQELYEIVTADGGALVLAHPFRRYCPAFRGYLEAEGLVLNSELAEADFLQGLAAVEVVNGNASAEEDDQAAELARILDLPGVGGSDAHARRQVGRAATWFPDGIHSEEDLVMALKQGDYRPVQRRKRR